MTRGTWRRRTSPSAPAPTCASRLQDLYTHLEGWLRDDERLLVHLEELGDRVMGVMAGFLLWSHRLAGGPQAIAVVERLVGHQMGPPGRDIVAQAATLDVSP